MISTMSKPRRFFSKENYPALILLSVLFLSLILVIIFITDYGLSFDEIFFYQYGDINLNAIRKSIYGLPFDSLFNFYDLKYYGPAYLILGTSVVRLIRGVFPHIDIYHVWHILNFGVFLSGAWFLFVLCKRFVSEKVSLFAALLFLTQPLLWGHGVMNPKDTPFMVFFLASITFGLIAFDKITAYSQIAEKKQAISELGRKRRKYGLIVKILLVILGIFFVFCVIDRVLANALARPIIDLFFEKIQQSAPGSFLFTLRGKILTGEAQGIAISAYSGKVLQLVNLVESFFMGLLLLLGLIVLLIKIPSVYRWMILAGTLLGLTTSIRVLGPAAGGLVSLYAVFTFRKKSIKYLAVYLGTAIVAMYIFWPYLWLAPIGRFIECFKVMSNFPWGGSVLFNGREYLATNLPRYYLPELLSIQFTLPLVLFAIVGTIFTLIKWKNDKKTWQKYFVIIMWFFVPLVLTILIRPTMYENFRQFLFIVPPSFVFAAVGVESLFSRVKKNHFRVAFYLLLLIPGLAAGVWLHPYEYVYYNGLVGWTANIDRKFENDYWDTSLCEAAHYLSSVASEGSQIAFTYPDYVWMFESCTNNNYQYLSERVENEKINPDYSVIPIQYSDDIDYFRSMTTIKAIARGNTKFLVIKAK